MRKEEAPALSFIVGLIELHNLFGAESLYEWMKKIGERIAEMEGKGMEGKKMNDVYYLSTCPLIASYHFVSNYEKLSKSGYSPHVNLEELRKEQKAEDPALGGILCIMHHAYRKKRAELAGKRVFHLSAKSHLTTEPVFNEKAIERCGKKKEEIEKILDSGACVFKYEPD